MTIGAELGQNFVQTRSRKIPKIQWGRVWTPNPSPLGPPLCKYSDGLLQDAHAVSVSQRLQPVASMHGVQSDSTAGDSCTDDAGYDSRLLSDIKTT